MPNGRCRMHGGASTGPTSAEGVARILVAKLVHGRYTAKMVQLRRMLAAERRAFRELLQLEQK